ncbi:MAG: hypothetical protein AMK69_27385 [Nitrospira bacterium SG8_3]|nr:MAG: hypothetical protein AMK69_27385 [Nitrospira bacterium SG8_3]
MLEYWNNGLRGCRKRRFGRSRVIPAKAGIQFIQFLLDSRVRGSDSIVKFFIGLLKKFKNSVAIHDHYSNFPLFHHSSSPVEL